MIARLEQQEAPSIQRALHDLPLIYQAVIRECYQRILPVLLLLLNTDDILERNRTWAGVSPKGKRATRFLTLKGARLARATIQSYAAQSREDADELWQLCQAYFRYGPIGLVDALSSQLPPLIPDDLQECADFHRLAKHPRSDAGLSIRELLNAYADALTYQRIPPFVARYAWATDRKIERWFFGESDTTELITKTTRRLNLDLPYPHQRWHVQMAPLPLPCILAQRHPFSVEPWLTWITDEYTSELMGIRVCPARPTTQDLWLTYRWSIWHFDAPWWKARGAPDTLVVPAAYFDIPEGGGQALRYLHCTITREDTAPTNAYLGLPDSFTHWIADVAEMVSGPTPSRVLTLADVTNRVLDYLSDANATTSAINPPNMLRDRGVSLPWESGIAAALLLPSAGVEIVHEGRVWPFGVPFDAAAGDLSDGQSVEVRYDPVDARYVYLIFNGAHVRRVSASAFEHRVAWAELIDNPAVLMEKAV